MESDGPPDPDSDGRGAVWGLDPAVAMLNHGSFGACPVAVLRRQGELRRQMEAEPVRFFLREMPPLLDESRRALAALIGARPEDLVFVSNATAGVNGVLRSLRFRPGDELLVTNHGYNACSNVARYVAQRDGAALVVAEIPLPIESPEQVIDGILARVTGQTRIVLIDHITSPTAAIFPVERLVCRLDQLGIDALIDGAHAPGMIPLDVGRIGAAYYTGNCHKWLCTPKGVGFLHVREDRQDRIEPPIISHGFNQPRPGRSRFQDAFDWPGTHDPTAALCVGESIRFLQGLVEGGLEGLMRRNRETALAARRMLCQRAGLDPACPEEMIGAMAAMRVPRGTDPSADPTQWPAQWHPLGRELFERFGIEVPVYYWTAPLQTLVRISAQAYNRFAEYERLADALAALVPAERS